MEGVRNGCVTINNKRSCAAASFGNHISSHTGVVSRVRKSGLLDDQIVINCDQKIGVLRWINDVLIFQPVNLETSKNRPTRTAEIKMRKPQKGYESYNYPT